jgi:hypothetical protein
MAEISVSASQPAEAESAERPDLGGEASCYAHLVCEECGVVLDGSPHAVDCVTRRDS